MTSSRWGELTSLARAIRAADWFDEEEREYKFEIAGRVRSVLELARDGGDWLAGLHEVFKSQPYNLTNFRQHQWLRDWVAAEPDLGVVVAGFLDVDLDPVERFDRFAAAAEAAGVVKGHGASVLAFGSLFNFAAQPESLPLVRARVFESVERQVGLETASSDAPTERYKHHLRFAQEARERMQLDGVPIRDMVDVQGVVWVLSPQAEEQLQRLAEDGHEAAVKAWDIRSDDAEHTPTEAAGSVSREAVLTAITEFDELGRESFLEKYGFGRALKYVLVANGKSYDSKAIYGVAYWIDHPDDGWLRSSDFSGGEHQVARHLRQLGFEVREDGASPEMRVWIVRAGREGLYEDLALEEGVAVIGWSELGPLTPGVAKDELKKLVQDTYAEERPQAVAVQAGQIYRFVREIEEGDLVVLPRLAHAGHVAVGRISGEYQFRDDGPFSDADAKHTRAVEWIVTDVPYGNFAKDIRAAFGQQGTVSELSRTKAAERILEVVSGGSEPALHLLLRWSFDREPQTIDLHREIAEEHGAVWWAKFGDPAGRSAVAATRIKKVRDQLANGVETFAYLYRRGEEWRARLQAIQPERPDQEAELIPAYYRDDVGKQHLWLKLATFEQMDEGFVETSLELYDTPGPIEGALKGQASLLYVRERGSGVSTRVWWVNQGSSLRRARAGGYLWAPQLDKAGRTKGHWDALKDARVGDLVLNFASGSIRGVSRVVAQAVEAPRPDPVADARWGEQGWLARIDYQDLSEPLPLTDIPEGWRRTEEGPFTAVGGVKQGYFYPLSAGFAAQLAARFPQLALGPAADPLIPSYEQPSFPDIVDFISSEGMSLKTRVLRRYHLSLKTRGFVILSGISGSGKTWLAELYAEAVGAAHLLVAVAPNWTTNEDLLGYLNPLSGEYHHTPFSRFLREAAEEYEAANRQGRTPKPFHLTLDEMNLARVEYYFARFLSAMEVRARNGTAAIELAPGQEVLLTPNLYFTGTVNVDETTHGFADKVYDRAQLLELVVSRDELLSHMTDAPYADGVMTVWDAVEPIAPFAFRVLDEVGVYVEAASNLDVPWEEAVDEQLLQKVLPKLKGADLRLEQALIGFIEASASFPLSREKASTMLQTFKQHGFTSFF